MLDDCRVHIRVHVFGASGSGTTALGSALGAEYGVPHLDIDNYYWHKTDPPFVEKIPPQQRIEMIDVDTQNMDSWVLSGSLCNWGGVLVDDFTFGVFLHVQQSIRMQRLYDRERQRYGDRINPKGDMYQQHIEFISWARSYDSAKAPTRSFDLHNSWMKRLSFPVLRIDSNQPVETLVQAVKRAAV